MQIAVVVYPGFTALDVVGPYEVLARLPEAEVFFVAETPGLVRNELGSLSVDVVAALEDVPSPQLVLVGGGPGRVAQMSDGRLHRWLRSVAETSTWTASVCTGALILGASGVLVGRRATTHWNALDELQGLGVTPSRERVVIDGRFASAAGVSAGIDLALTLAAAVAGDEVAQAIQLMIEYAPEPPFDTGSVNSAPAAIVEQAKRWLAGQPDGVDRS